MTNEVIAAIVTIATGGFGLVTTYLNNKNKEHLAEIEILKEQLESQDNDMVPPIKYHAIFKKVEIFKTGVVHNLELSSRGRTLIAQNVLSNKLEFCNKEFYEVAAEHDKRQETCDGDCGNCQWVYNSYMQAINNVLASCGSYYKNSNYSTEEQAILDLVWEQFNHYHTPNVARAIEAIERTTSSKFYKSCKVQSSIILDTLQWVLGTAITDAEDTFKNINGQLTGRGPFRGVIVDYEKLQQQASEEVS